MNIFFFSTDFFFQLIPQCIPFLWCRQVNSVILVLVLRVMFKSVNSAAKANTEQQSSVRYTESDDVV